MYNFKLINEKKNNVFRKLTKFSTIFLTYMKNYLFYQQMYLSLDPSQLLIYEVLREGSNLFSL